MSIDFDKAEFIGEGEFVKNCAYQVYKYGNEYYAVCVEGHERYIIEETVELITEDEISDYI